MENLEQYIAKHRANKEKSEDLVVYLSALLKDRDYSKDSDFYNKANVSRQTWSNIMSGKGVTLNTLLKIVFTLECNTHKCKYLLKKAGYTLSSASEYALIIRYHIENKIYDLDIVNDCLIKHGFEDKDLIY